MVGNRFHCMIGKFHRLIRSVGDAQHMQAILEAHDAQSHRTMLEVGIARLGDGIEIDIDHIVQHAHGGADSALELGGIKLAVMDMRRQIDRAQIAHRDFVIIGIQGYLGAEIGAMHYTDVVLRRADIAGDP